MEGQKWWKMTLLKVWSPGRSLAGRSLSGRSISGPKYISGPNYSLGRSCFRAEVYKRAEVFSGPKLFRAKVFPGQSIPGRSIFGPKWVSGQSCLWAKLGVSQQFCSTRVGNSGNVLLTSRNRPKYFYQCIFFVFGLLCQNSVSKPWVDVK